MTSEDWLKGLDTHVDTIVEAYVQLNKHIEDVENITDAETCDHDVLKATMVIKLTKLEKKIEEALE